MTEFSKRMTVRVIIAGCLGVALIGWLFLDLFRDTVDQRIGANETGIRLEGFDFSEVLGEALKWRLVSRLAVELKGSGRIRLTGIDMTFYQDERPIHVTAREGVFYPNTRDVELLGGVRVDLDGLSVVTESVRYDGAQEMLTSGGAVLAEWQDGGSSEVISSLRGDSAVLFPGERRFIMKDVTGTILF